MQDRYAGDIGDFGKIALLRMIQSEGLSIGVNWYKVDSLDSEIKKDGSFKQEDGRHLIPKELAVCDAALAKTLTAIAKSKDRSVRALEEADLIPGATYYHEPLSAAKRAKWHSNAIKVLNKDKAEIVFLDPDNGMIVKSVNEKSARSVKYVLYKEVADYIKRGQSVLIYNHRSRIREEIYFQKICEKLSSATEVPEDQILKITFPKRSVRDYFAVPASSNHRAKIEEAFARMIGGIWGRNGICRSPLTRH